MAPKSDPLGISSQDQEAQMSKIDPHFRRYALDDRYTRTQGRVFMTGTQALARIMLDQARRDRAAGLDTAGFVSGYRG